MLVKPSGALSSYHVIMQTDCVVTALPAQLLGVLRRATKTVTQLHVTSHGRARGLPACMAKDLPIWPTLTGFVW